MARAVVVAEFVVLRDDDHLVAAAGHDPVHSLETGVRFDVLAVRIEQVEPVVRADPEKRVRRHGDLLDEVARQGGYSPQSFGKRRMRSPSHMFSPSHEPTQMNPCLSCASERMALFDMPSRLDICRRLLACAAAQHSRCIQTR